MGIADLSQLAAQEIKNANRMQLVGGLLGGVGTLANTINAVYQASKGRTPIDIGNPLIAGGEIANAVGSRKREQGQQYVAREMLGKIPVDQTARSIAEAQIAAGNSKEALSGLNDIYKQQVKPLDLNADEQLLQKLGPEGFMRYKQSLASAGRTNINVGPEATNRYGYLKSRALEIGQLLSNPENQINRSGKFAGQRQQLVEELGYINKELGINPPSQTEQISAPQNSAPATTRMVYDPNTGQMVQVK